MSGPLAMRMRPDAAEAAASLRTIRDLLRHAESRFRAADVAFGHGTDDAYDEAAWLVLWSLHLPPHRLEQHLDAALTPSELRDAVALIERRCNERIPTAYLTGEAWLRGLRFECDARALVPRSLIAELLDEDGLANWLQAQRVGAVLDLCTGGGSIAVFAAFRYPQATVQATDLSADALALARRNLALHRVADRIDLAQGDLYEPVGSRRFDLIITNPPYVNAGSMADLPPEFRAEPQGALAGGTDGMDLVRRIVAGARERLLPGGLLVIEIGHEADHFEAAFPALEFTYLPTAGSERAVVLVEHDALP
jgi:ribosomal protein L3 glutamine methyltransferase